MTPINFKANFLKTVYLPHISQGKSSDKEVSIVELDNKDERDMAALAKTACDWEKYASGYAFEIYNDALKDKPYPDVYKEHYLALTTQNCDYANLDSNKILLLSHIYAITILLLSFILSFSITEINLLSSLYHLVL